MKTTKREELSCTCDVCEMEFPHAEPNQAIADVMLPGVGWVFVCEGHCPSSEEN